MKPGHPLRPLAAIALIVGSLVVFFLGGLALSKRLDPFDRTDYRHFYAVGQSVWEGTNIYESGEGGYIYPPLLSLVFAALSPLGPARAPWAWFGLNCVMTWLALWLGYRELVRRWHVPDDFFSFAVFSFVAVQLSNGQIRGELMLGQTDTITVLGFILALRWMERRPWLAGLIVGVAANVKYVSLAMVPFFLVRRQWKAALSTVLGFVATALSSALFFGWEKNLQYQARAYQGVARLLGVDVGQTMGKVYDLRFERSISIPSGLARMTDSSSVAILGTAAAAVFFTLIAWRLYHQRGVGFWSGQAKVTWTGDRAVFQRGLHLIEWAVLICVAMAISPQTNKRHMFVLLLPHLVMAALMLAPAAVVWRWWLVGGVVVFQLALRLPPKADNSPQSLTDWQWTGGPSWVLLVMAMALLWTGLVRLTTPEPARTSESSANEISSDTTRDAKAPDRVLHEA